MDAKLLARIMVVALVALMIIATALERDQQDKTRIDSDAKPAATEKADPLHDELVRCTRIGEAGPHDPDCRHVWARNRERFLGAPPTETHSESSVWAPLVDEAR